MRCAYCGKILIGSMCDNCMLGCGNKCHFCGYANVKEGSIARFLKRFI